jgi:hypothetical protein
MKDLTTVELIHLAILQDAAREANHYLESQYDSDPANRIGYIRGRFNPKTRRQQKFSGEVFRPWPGRSSLGGLCLTVDPQIMEILDDEERELFRIIALEAVRKAIIKNQDKFVGLIIGEARHNRNYFDRFVPEGGQTTLF